MNIKEKKKLNLIGMSKESLEKFFNPLMKSLFERLKSLNDSPKGVSDISQMTDLSKSLRQKLLELCEIRVPEVVYEKLK